MIETGYRGCRDCGADIKSRYVLCSDCYSKEKLTAARKQSSQSKLYRSGNYGGYALMKFGGLREELKEGREICARIDERKLEALFKFLGI